MGGGLFSGLLLSMAPSLNCREPPDKPGLGKPGGDRRMDRRFQGMEFHLQVAGRM